MKFWYYTEQVNPVEDTHFICLAKQTEIQLAQLSTVIATLVKHLNFQKLTTNLVLGILTSKNIKHKKQ